MLTNILIFIAIIAIVYGVYQWFSIKATVQQQEYNIRETMNIVQDLVNVVGSTPQHVSDEQQPQPTLNNIENKSAIIPCQLSELNHSDINISNIEHDKICVSDNEEETETDSDSDSGSDTDDSDLESNMSESDDEDDNNTNLDTDDLSVHSAVDGVFDLDSFNSNIKEDEDKYDNPKLIINSSESESDFDSASESDSDSDSESDSDSGSGSKSDVNTSELSPVLLESSKNINAFIVGEIIDEVVDNIIKDTPNTNDEVVDNIIKLNENDNDGVIENDTNSVNNIIRNIENEALYDDETDFEMSINTTLDHSSGSYKKWALPKLKNLVVERGIILEEGVKYKKNDYISLLETYDTEHNQKVD